jgi:hypothetical protein
MQNIWSVIISYNAMHTDDHHWFVLHTELKLTEEYTGEIKYLEYSLTQLPIMQFIEMYFQSYLPATRFGSYNWSHLHAELLRLVCKLVCLLAMRSCITTILQNCGIKYTIYKLDVVLEYSKHLYLH